MPTFTNQAQLTYNNTVVNSNVAVGEIVQVLSATKTALSGSYTIGDKITYAVGIVNTGNTPFTGITVTDDLGAYTFGEDTTLYPLTYVDGSVLVLTNGVPGAEPTVTAGPPLVISGITVPANGSVVIIYEAEVNAFAPGDVGGTITNTVTISGEGLSTPITADETVTVDEGPDLTITKSISPIPVNENGQVTYTFTIQNYGNAEADAEYNVTLTDTFDPILSNITVQYNGAILTEGTDYTYDQTTGLFATVPGRITVPAATFAQDPVTGVISVTPGVSTLVVTGTI